ncbi:tryptophan 7-halogenase [Sphingomonas sp. ABOLE]|uniref:tryptophan halogenase family protein n=1 Tax=Sphingomonas sp. ABOLE TaxID=1985878 RepID=UPI000F7EA26B|nr:tryptophan halogenase family protein [Sphingomonas sp. ABOLE]RSV37303.1 tryptophan 7-halogenase [Sphingomonas sp. ABOLE]
MTGQPSLRVVIVGGGTSGWMTAAAIARLLPARCSLHLIESEAIGVIGVGEATLPHIRGFIEKLGIREADFMAWTRGTFKLGIEFRDWGKIGDSYVHPFGTFGRGTGEVDFHHYWTRLRLAGVDVPPLERFSYGCMLARANRFDLPAADPSQLASTYGYAYQFDALLFAPYLRSIAEGLGAVRTEGKVVEVLRDGASGNITAVRLDNGECIEGDLFVDCSGFRSLLLGEALAEPFEDWNHWLPADRAVAMPCRTATSVTPYTSAIAMPAGWRWRIPLQHRTGNGYVYASAFTSDAAATQALTGAVEGAALADPRVLRFRAGRRRRSWVKNCVAIGLASGFLEPLESTSIYLVQQAITALIELFPEAADAPIERDEFNRLIDLEYDRIRDFLILHYHATTRTDTDFWNYVRTMTVPDSLAEKIELFRRAGRVVKYREGVFLDASWIAVYVGQGILPEGYDPRADAADAAALLQGMRALEAEIAATVARVPEHLRYIDRYCAMAAAA